MGMTLPAVLLVALAGCYTQLGMVRHEDIAPARPATDSTGERVEKVDTVRVTEREVCYWTRDLLGYPVLRCRESRYSRDWFLYNDVPWWYRHDPYFYDYDRCPRYYYYDRSCGCCRYYRGNRRYYNPGSGSGSKDEPDDRPRKKRPRSRSLGVPKSSGETADPQGQSKRTGSTPSTSTSEDDRSQTPVAPARPGRAESTDTDNSGAQQGSSDSSGDEKDSEENRKPPEKRPRPGSRSF